MSRRPLHVADHGLTERLAGFSELDEEDRTSLLRVLDAFLMRRRLRAIAGGARGRSGAQAAGSLGMVPDSATGARQPAECRGLGKQNAENDPHDFFERILDPFPVGRPCCLLTVIRH